MADISLDSSIGILPGVGPKRRQTLEAAGLKTLRDLLLYLPFRYVDASEITPIAQLDPPQTVTLHATVVKHFPVRNRGKRSMILTTIADDSGQMTLSFFNQPFAMSALKIGERYAFTGLVKLYKNRPSLSNPAYEPLNRENLVHTGRIIPIYPQTKELSMRGVRQLLYQALFSAHLRLPEYLQAETIEQEKLMPRDEALAEVHFPSTLAQAKAARRRLAFDELWTLFQAMDEQEKKRRHQRVKRSLSLRQLEKNLGDFEACLPFPLTNSQKQACREIATSLSQAYPTNHLVQGEVGSGKTVVAAFALTQMAQQGCQALYLAPTTILAEQHWHTVGPIAEKLGLTCSLWTSSDKQDEQADIIVGTHALLQSKSSFQPGVVVSDEEHRFGVKQREYFWQESVKPHLISMTATPIPRTLATLLFQGQEEASFLQAIPGKEKHVTTRVFAVNKLRDHFTWLEKTVTTSDQQAFLIAPFIHPSETEGFESVFDAHSLFSLAQQSMPQARVALLTGEQSEKEKNRLLEEMRLGKYDVLVATPVIEVGIDLPQASIITVTSAERFGLAQLHQLRGRVGRQGQASWCFLVPSPGATNLDRLKQLEHIQHGNELAELDLQLRGAGEFLGTRQSGWDTLEIASWFDLPLLQQVSRLQTQRTRVVLPEK